MAQQAPLTTEQLDDDIVAEYLREHPRFFLRRDDLLSELQLPHASGNAISLVEKQVAILRERNMDMRHRLSNLLENARDNDQLFERTQRLILALLEGSGADELVSLTEHALLKDFNVDYCRLTLLGQPMSHHTLRARMVPAEEAHEKAGAFTQSEQAVCGVLRDEEIEFLFGEPLPIASAAVAAIGQPQCHALLAIGSEDAERYRTSTGTVFLNFVAEVLARKLPSYLSRQD